MVWKTVLSGSFFLLANHIFWRGSMMLSSMMLSAALEIDEFAKYAYFQLTAAMIATFSVMGLGVAASKWFAEFKYSDDKPKLGFIWFVSILLSLFFSMAIFFIPAAWLGEDISISPSTLALGVFVFSINILPGAALQGLEAYRASVFVSAVSGFVLLLGVFWAKNFHDSSIAIYILIFSTFIQFFGATVVVFRVVSWREVLCSILPNKSSIFELLKLAGPMLLVSVLAASGTWLLGRLILSFSENKSLFASYAIGMQWFAFSLLIPGVIAKVLLPKLIRVRGDVKSVSLILRSNIFLSVVASLLVCVICGFFSPLIMKLYGGGTEYSKYLIFYYVAAAIFVAPINIMSSAFIANGYQADWLGLTVVWFFSLIFFAFVFRHFDLMGALSLALSYMIFSFFSFIVGRCRKII